MPDLVGVGHCCYDYLCIIREYPPEDGSTRITAIHSQGGGAVATALVAAARLGVQTALIANLGADGVGELITSELEAEGVDLAGVDRLPGVSSLTSYVMIQPQRGTRTKFPLLDRTPPIVWDERRKGLLQQAKVLHLDGTHYQNARSAAELAKDYGVTISLDGCTRQEDNTLNKELAASADILITNAAYPTAVTGKATMESALLELAAWGPQIVMATIGAESVLAVIDGKVRHFPAKPAQVVDTTGAGDVFHGAFLAAYLAGKDLVHCIHFAQYAAARKCEHIGGRKGIPRWEEVEQHYLV
jgi:sugar/nucleoside kinase (ribokinase family)